MLLPGLWSLSSILLYVSVVLCTALHHSTTMGISYLLYRHHQSCHVLVQPHETLSALDSEFHSVNWTVRSTQMCFVFRLYPTFVIRGGGLFAVSPVLNKNQTEYGCGIEVTFFFSGSFQLTFEIHSHTGIRNEDLMILPACLPYPFPNFTAFIFLCIV